MNEKVVKNQIIGSVVDCINQKRLNILEQELAKILEKKLEDLAKQDINLLKAMECVNAVKDFISKPEHILGSPVTKHGEVAEHLQVGITNAKSLINGGENIYTFEGVGRTAPEDYLTISGEQVQSKFINGVKRNLEHILEHKEKYESFTENGFYEIPKNHYDVIKKIINNEEVEGYKLNTLSAIKEKIKEIEEVTGKKFNEAVKPSNYSYDEVQLGKVNEVIDREEQEIRKSDIINREKINNDAENETRGAYNNSKPSFKEGIKSSGIAAAIGASLSFSFSVYKKYKEGKRINDFTEDDWKEVGIETGKGGLKGGITGLGIYGFSNYTSMSAPLAGAYTSTVLGILSLSKRYKKNEISLSEFITSSEVLGIEASMTFLGATLGQVLIPIPILGAVLGTVTTSFLGTISKDFLENKEQEEIDKYYKFYKIRYVQIDKKYENDFINIINKYFEYGRLTEVVFNYDLNAILRFGESRDLALKLEVNKKEVLKNKKEIDDYFLN